MLGVHCMALLHGTADTATLTARNKESAPLFNQVYAELIPESQSKVKASLPACLHTGFLHDSMCPAGWLAGCPPAASPCHCSALLHV